tara:strand:+ start:1280 stop:2284 length:1005 start_codon:yes stop_codon:yes gene_type:complete
MTEYVQPQDFPWFKCSNRPVPNLTGDILLGEQVTTDRGNIVNRVEFRDLDHMRTHLDAALPYEEWDKHEVGGCHEWVYDGTSREETIECWDKGIAPSDKAREVYEEMRDELAAQFVSSGMQKCRSRRRRRVHAWAGGSVNIPKYLESREAGVPAPVFRTMSKRADRPVVRIGLNTSMSCNMSQEKFARIGAITACMCEKFEELGYGVEVVSISCGLWESGPKRRVGLDGRKLTAREAWQDCWAVPIVPIKRADEPLDAERVLSMGQPGTLRDLGFRARYLCLGVTGSCSVPDLPEDVVEACGCDVVIERKWSRDDPEKTADRIVGKMKEMIGED